MTSAVKIPHLGYMDDINVDNVYQLSRGRKDFTMLSIFIKAVSLALSDYPELNSTVNEDVTELKMRYDHNIGIAMDTPRGLIVPVIPEVQKKSVFDITKEINHLKEKGQLGKLGPADLADPTITLSNIGSIGGTYASPIILPPQVAIGALGKAKRIPLFETPTSMIIKEARIMPVSWVADHRVIDGASVARFSNRFKFFVENPIEMLVRMK